MYTETAEANGSLCVVVCVYLCVSLTLISQRKLKPKHCIASAVQSQRDNNYCKLTSFRFSIFRLH